ncbi:hypothetical protein JMUB7548_01990 [Staphylococcus aureus]
MAICLPSKILATIKTSPPIVNILTLLVHKTNLHSKRRKFKQKNQNKVRFLIEKAEIACYAISIIYN